jgi:competence protein ComEC
MELLLKRPVVSFCIMMIIGILVSFLSNSILAAVCFALLILSCFFAFGLLRRGSFFVPVGMLVFFLLGSMEFILIDRLQDGRFEAFEGKEVAVHGYIASEPEFKGERVTYIIRADTVRLGYYGVPVRTGGKLLLSTVKGEDGSFFDFGREIEFEGVLSLPTGVRNPGGFDYRRYLMQKVVGASVFAYPYTIEAGKGKKGNFLVQMGLSIRKRIIYVIENSLPPQQAGLMNGMLIGYREGLSEEVQEAFSNAGLTHIMAVSGANVAFLILPLAFLLKRLRVRRIAANLFIIAFLILFVFITGFEPSVLRAVIMAIILLVAAIIYREPDTYAAIAFSCILILAANPCMLFNVGFQLSYAATLSIVMLYKNIKKLISRRFMPGWITEVLAATIAAQMGVLPITLICFNKVSIIAIIPNLLAVPMLEVITILGTLMAILGQFSLLIAQIIGYLCNVLLSAVLLITKLASSVPFAVLKTVTPSIVMAVAYYIIVWFLLWYKPIKNIQLKPRHAAIGLSFAAVFFLFSAIAPHNLEVFFLDVGQGDSAFIRTAAGKTVLIDGGGSSDPTHASNIGKSVVVPFLLDNGVNRLDAVIATHPHSDHTQGLEDVLEQFKVGRLIIPSINDESGFAALFDAAAKGRVAVSRCGAGDVIRLDEKTRLAVLSPEKGFIVDPDSLNSTSIVLKLVYDQTDILFTGDAESDVEEGLIAKGVSLDADVIKIAHHGSRTSTTAAWLERVHPKAAIISVGRNYFGHPAQTTLDLLDQMGISFFRTDECGAVVLNSNGKTVKLKRTVSER